MTQTSLFQYTVPTAGPDDRPLYRRTSREWVDYLAGITVPHAYRPPRVEISNEHSAPGADHLLAFFHCQITREGLLDPLSNDDYYGSRDDELFPEIMAALFSLTAELIADGWWIQHCDVLGRSRLDGKIEPRIIAMRWHEGRVVDSPRWRYITDPYEPKMMDDRVPLRCAEDLVRCRHCNGAGCVFCNYRGATLSKRGADTIVM